MGARGELDALRVGGIIEETDIRDLSGIIANTTHADLEKVYENLLCGSRNHLRAFVRTIESKTGQPYAAQVIQQAEVDAILGSPAEQCGSC